MWTAIIGPILGIVEKGIVAWNEERRARFMDEHNGILTDLRLAENAVGEDYNDDELGLIKERFVAFIDSYGNELGKHNEEKGFSK